MARNTLPVFDTDSAFAYYQSIVQRLPVDSNKDVSRKSAVTELRRAADLLELVDRFDVFVFDAFGVLNVGDKAISGAAECITALRQAGKQIYVLTNGASANLSSLPKKFTRFGFDFIDDEVISSRYCTEAALERIQLENPSIELWGAITCGLSSVDDLNVPAIDLTDDLTDDQSNELGNDPGINRADYDRVDAFVFLSASTWDESHQAVLFESLKQKPRLLLVANPDVVAPREDTFSLEPGYFSHELISQCAVPYEFHGKPFASVFEEVERRCGGQIPLQRIAMLGDTLHTDVLGANARGWSSILVSDHGLFRGRELNSFIDQSGITPDWIIPSI